MNVIRRSVACYYLSRFFNNASFTLGIYLLFFTGYIGLSFTQALLLYIIQLLVSTAFDFVGGGLADTFGKKRSYLIGSLGYLLLFTIPVIFIKDYSILVLLSVLAGIADALSSNSLASLIAELLDHDQKRYREVNARSQAVMFIARAAAAAAGGVLYQISAPLPFIATAIAATLAILFAFGIHEVPPAKAGRASAGLADTRATLADALIHIRHTSPQVLWASVSLGLAAFLAGDILFTYYQPFFERNGYGAIFLGLLTAAISLASAAGSWSTQYFHHRGWRLGLIAWICVLIAVNGIAYIIAAPMIVLGTVIIQAFAQGMTVPTRQLIVNESTPSRIRASVLSASSTITSSFVIVGFLFGGLLADHGTPQQAGWLVITLCAAGLAVILSHRRRTMASGTMPTL